jgi:hypothetical protein
MTVAGICKAVLTVKLISERGRETWAAECWGIIAKLQ